MRQFDVAAEWRNYRSLVAVLLRNAYSLNKIKSAQRKQSQRTAALIGGIVGGIALGAYMTAISVAMAYATADAGLLKEWIYTVIAAVQLAVLFLGAITVVSNLYFSKDMPLLTTLPISARTLFAAKLTVAYVNQLVLAAFLTVFLVTPSGAVGMLTGAGIRWYFFVFELIGIAFLPVLPLLIVAIVSLPLMYVASFFKKHAAGKSIAAFVLYGLIFAVYFAFIFGMNALTVTDPDGNTVLNPQAVSLIRGFAAATVFNFPLVEAMAGGRPVLILAYFAGLIALLAIAVALCSVFYRKAIRQNAEGGGAAPKKSTAAQYRSAPVTRLLIEKEIKSVLTTPNLLISSLMGIVMAPVFMFVFGKVLPVGFGGTSEGGFNSAVGMVTYLAYLMSAMGSLTSAVGISREGKNFALLKSLPIAPSVVIRSKLLFSAGITAVSVVINTVVFPFATGVTSPVAIVGFVLAILCGGVGNSTLGLYYDLKNPNLKWTNPNELTQNNKKMLKPTLISVGAGIVFLILSPVAAMLGWNHHAAYALFFGTGLVLPVATAVYGIVKLKDHPEKLWDQIEI